MNDDYVMRVIRNNIIYIRLKGNLFYTLQSHPKQLMTLVYLILKYCFNSCVLPVVVFNFRIYVMLNISHFYRTYIFF